ncbi:MAG: type II secretion system F family protein [Vampirovibrionales bacterium]|nr:type II secretion system F family protein [Vampirovibrionales bacterium]
MPPLTIALIAFAGLLLVGAAFFLTFQSLALLFPEKDPVHSRLDSLKQLKALGGRAATPRKDLFETLVDFSTPLSQQFYRGNDRHYENVKTLLAQAGQADHDTAVNRFLAVEIAVGMVCAGFGLLGGFMIGVKNFGLGMGMVVSVGALIAGLLLGKYLALINIRSKAGKRKTEIRYTLPDTLDLMVVCVEAGLGLDSTIQRIGDETERMAPELSYEFKRLNKELNAGIQRGEAFSNLGTRSGVDELRSLCSMIVQADKLGTSVADSLRVYADDVRVRRRQKAEELAAKASTKMTIPLVFFVFPPLFIVLMAPMLISSLGSFMGGAGSALGSSVGR